MSQTTPPLSRAARRRLAKRWLKQHQYLQSGFAAPEYYVIPQVRGKDYRAARSGS
jgi:hypothetical protein